MCIKKKNSNSKTPHPGTVIGPFIFSILVPAAVAPLPGLAMFFFCVLLGLPFSASQVPSDSLSTSWGLSLLAPTKVLFSDARRQGCLWGFSSIVFVVPLLWCLRPHICSKCPSR